MWKQVVLRVHIFGSEEIRRVAPPNLSFSHHIGVSRSLFLSSWHPYFFQLYLTCLYEPASSIALPRSFWPPPLPPDASAAVMADTNKAPIAANNGRRITSSICSRLNNCVTEVFLKSLLHFQSYSLRFFSISALRTATSSRWRSPMMTLGNMRQRRPQPLCAVPQQYLNGWQLSLADRHRSFNATRQL
jgi:hypothetical protein